MSAYCVTIRTEVEIGENVDYGETDLRHIIEGDSRYNRDESFGDYGYQQQEFKDGELVGVEGDDDSSDDFEGNLTITLMIPLMKIIEGSNAHA